MKIYKINILRYGNEDIGEHLFGYFSNKDEGIEEARRYNTLRGGKYPEIFVFEIPLDKEIPFEDVFPQRVYL